MNLAAPAHNNDLPFVFLPSYASYLNKWSNGKSIVKIVEDGDVLIPICLNKVGPFYTGQLLYHPVKQDGTLPDEKIEKEMLENMIPFLASNKICIKLLAPPEYFVFRQVPAKSVSCRFGHFSINLSSHSEEELFQGIHPKHRNVIKNAEKNNVTIKYGKEVLNDFYLLYKQTMDRQQIFCDPFNFFETMFTVLGEDNMLCGVAYYENKPQGAIFMPYTNYGGYYLYGATADNIEVTGAMNYLHWKAMLLLKSENVQRYSMGGARLTDVTGTKLDGIQKFKSRFGGELQQGYLWKKQMAPFKCLIIDNLLKAKFMMAGIKINKDMIDRERGRELSEADQKE